MTLEITELSKRIDNNWILKDVSLEAHRGQIVGLFGSTGAGKSTLLDIVAGEVPKTAGNILFESNIISDSVKCGLLFPGGKTDSLWKSLFNQRNESKMSQGSAQALAFDEALQNAADLLLLDNPFCLMDRKLRQSKITALHKAVREKNLTVLFSTPDFEEIFLVCDQVAVLSEGMIVQTGTPRAVYESPKSSAAARITGSNNLISARRLTSSKTDIPEFQTIDGDHRLFTDKLEKSSLAAINQNSWLTIRPEHISISFGASFPEDNLLKAEIVEVVYEGATTVIRLNANGLILEALVLRLVGLNVGDECMVGLPPDRINVFKD